MYGHVTRLEDDVVIVQAAPGLELRIARRAIAGITRDEAPDPGAPGQ
jgi:preprotein translocase subunit YajC